MKRKHDILKYPHVADFYGLDRYINPDTGRFALLHSPSKNSPQSRVNSILGNIQKESGIYSYIHNRLRERISLEVLRIFLLPDNVELSSIINDIYYGIDATCDIRGKGLVIDFTENPNTINGKLQETRNGNKKTSEDSELPLLVYYIDTEFVSRILSAFELFLRDNSGYNRETCNLRCGYIIREMIKHDRMPEIITSVHMLNNPELIRTFLESTQAVIAKIKKNV